MPRQPARGRLTNRQANRNPVGLVRNEAIHTRRIWAKPILRHAATLRLSTTAPMSRPKIVMRAPHKPYAALALTLVMPNLSLRESARTRDRKKYVYESRNFSR